MKNRKDKKVKRKVRRTVDMKNYQKLETYYLADITKDQLTIIRAILLIMNLRIVKLTKIQSML